VSRLAVCSWFERLTIGHDYQHICGVPILRCDMAGCRRTCLLPLQTSRYKHKFMQPFLAQIPVGFAVSLSITSCTRLLLNIRDAYYAQGENDTYRISTRRPLTAAHSIATGTSSSFWAQDESKPVRAQSIYAEYTARDQWVFELREMKWSGNLDS
jgi:hypothetical protein